MDSGLARPIVGQIVGRLNEVRSTRAVLDDLVEELVVTLTGMPAILDS